MQNAVFRVFRLFRGSLQSLLVAAPLRWGLLRSRGNPTNIDFKPPKKIPGHIRQGLGVRNPAEEIVCSPDFCLRQQLTLLLDDENKPGTKWWKLGVKQMVGAVRFELTTF